MCLSGGEVSAADGADIGQALHLVHIELVALQVPPALEVPGSLVFVTGGCSG